MRKASLLVLLALFLTASVSFGQQNPNSLTRARKDGKWGFRNSSGTFVIAPQFDWVSHFSEGLAAVMVGTKYGFVDETGRLVIKIRYTEVGDFSEGLVRVRKGGSTVYPTGASLTNRKDNNWQYLDKIGTTVFKIKADEVGDFSEGLASARIIKSGRFYCGYIDKQGRWVIAPQFETCGRFSQGIAKINLLTGEGRLIDPQGKFVSEKPRSQ